jgi:hypothetical protein
LESDPIRYGDELLIEKTGRSLSELVREAVEKGEALRGRVPGRDLR